jgi:hypothetical protein
MVFSAMRRTSCIIATFLLTSAASLAQTPVPSTLALSLKTMSKALAGCRTSYMRVYPGTSVPLLKSILGTEDFDKDLLAMGTAEKLVNFLIAHPEKVTGKTLVMILSSSDDFSVGVGSTRQELMRHVILDSADNAKVNEIMVASEALKGCQQALFDAGDDYVDLVMNYVGAEDDVVAARAAKGNAK